MNCGQRLPAARTQGSFLGVLFHPRGERSPLPLGDQRGGFPTVLFYPGYLPRSTAKFAEAAHGALSRHPTAVQFQLSTLRVMNEAAPRVFLGDDLWVVVVAAPAVAKSVARNAECAPKFATVNRLEDFD